MTSTVSAIAIRVAAATSGMNSLSRFAVNVKTIRICLMRPMNPTFSGCCALAMAKV